MKKNKGVLLIGFGGPRSMSEVKPFIAGVVEGSKVPKERLEAVARHYEAFGGVSPYNEITLRQKKALEAEFEARGEKIPVFVAFRHSTPSFAEAFSELRKKNIHQAIAFVLSPFRTYASFDKVREKLEFAQKESAQSDLTVAYTNPFHAHSLFVEAQAGRLRQTAAEITPAERRKSYFIFSAHSVPVAMSDKSGYAGQFLGNANLVAQKAGVSHWMAAYQSRSGDPKEPWLGPDIKDVIRAIDPSEYKNLVLIPSGFLCDNVEILYDLDIDARKTAEAVGLRYFRAATVMDDPLFIQMMADQVLETAV